MNIDDYFKDKNYVYEDVCGVNDFVYAHFKLRQIEFPTMQWGTCLVDIQKIENKINAKIKRFKTKELCKLHCIFPPSYERTGNTKL